jgi:hypothetical protein
VGVSTELKEKAAAPHQKSSGRLVPSNAACTLLLRLDLAAATEPGPVDGLVRLISAPRARPTRPCRHLARGDASVPGRRGQSRRFLRVSEAVCRSRGEAAQPEPEPEIRSPRDPKRSAIVERRYFALWRFDDWCRRRRECSVPGGGGGALGASWEAGINQGCPVGAGVGLGNRCMFLRSKGRIFNSSSDGQRKSLDERIWQMMVGQL